MLNITITGLDDALKAVDIDLRAAAPTIGVAVAEAVKNVAAPYPPVRRQRQPFKSDKSRRAFFAGLRDGSIQVPYRRSGVTGRSWQIAPTSDGATLTNNAPGVKYTTVAATQVRYHAGNWNTEVQAAEQAEAQGIPQQVAEAAVEDLIRKAGGA